MGHGKDLQNGLPGIPDQHHHAGITSTTRPPTSQPTSPSEGTRNSINGMILSRGPNVTGGETIIADGRLGVYSIVRGLTSTYAFMGASAKINPIQSGWEPIARNTPYIASYISNPVDQSNSWGLWAIASKHYFSGRVGMGTQNPDYALHVVGTAYATGAAGALSDARHKKNISDLGDNSLDIINQLHPVTFEWIDPHDSGMQGTQLGLIAQEVEEVLPNVVLTQDNDEQTKGLKYNEFIPLMIKAIQELKAENEALKSRVSLLE